MSAVAERAANLVKGRIRSIHLSGEAINEDHRQILAVDCEMCTVQGGHSALTRISVLDWNGKKIVDELVKPSLPIIDYLTP